MRNKLIRRFKGLTLVGFLFFIFAFLAIELHAQTGSTEGYIIDADTKKPLPKAKVTIVYDRSQNIKYEISTDEKGRFYRGGLTIGVYTINVEKEGYLPTSRKIRAQQGEPARLEIKLKSAGASLPESGTSSAQGMSLLNEGKYNKAIEKITQAISEESTNPSLYYYRGKSLGKSEKYDKALLDYQKAIELKSDFILAIVGMSDVYMKQGDSGKAVEFYKKAIDLGDANLATRFNYGVALMSTGKNAEAISVYEGLISLDPNYSEAYYQLGIIYINLNETLKARQSLEKFIDMDPQNLKSAIAKEILKILKSGLPRIH